MDLVQALIDTFIQTYKITDPNTIAEIDLTFRGYYEIMKGKPHDLETYTYTVKFQEYCNRFT